MALTKFQCGKVRPKCKFHRERILWWKTLTEREREMGLLWPWIPGFGSCLSHNLSNCTYFWALTFPTQISPFPYPHQPLCQGVLDYSDSEWFSNAPCCAVKSVYCSCRKIQTPEPTWGSSQPPAAAGIWNLPVASKVFTHKHTATADTYNLKNCSFIRRPSIQTCRALWHSVCFAVTLSCRPHFAPPFSFICSILPRAQRISKSFLSTLPQN